MSTIETFGSRWRTQAPGSSFNDETIPLGSVHNLVSGSQGFTGPRIYRIPRIYRFHRFQGFQGTPGSFGGSSFDYTFAGTGNSANSNGKVVLNNANAKDATKLYVYENDDSGFEITRFMNTLLSVDNPIKGFVRIFF